MKRIAGKKFQLKINKKTTGEIFRLLSLIPLQNPFNDASFGTNPHTGGSWLKRNFDENTKKGGKIPADV